MVRIVLKIPNHRSFPIDMPVHVNFFPLWAHGIMQPMITEGRFFNGKKMPEHLLNLQLRANIEGNHDRGWMISQLLWLEDDTNNRAAFNRGWHVLEQGDLQGGMALIDRGRFEKVFGSSALNSRAPIYDPRMHNLWGKMLMFRSEGGLGDEIINIRFVADFVKKGAKMVVSCDKGLEPIFRRIPGVVDCVRQGKEWEVAYDYWVPGMSAVRCTNHTYETLPRKAFLTANPEYISKWQKILGEKKKPRVGLRWSGNPQFEHEQFRRFPPEMMLKIAETSGVDFFSFQRDGDMQKLPLGIADLAPHLSSWEDTAAALSQMDLMITSCTSVAHMSAALGLPTWVIVPVLPYYLWAYPGNKSPWYETVTLFRQKKFNVWDETFAETYLAFEEWRKNFSPAR
jgi:hypothetical protein